MSITKDVNIFKDRAQEATEADLIPPATEKAGIPDDMITPICPIEEDPRPPIPANTTETNFQAFAIERCGRNIHIMDRSKYMYSNGNRLEDPQMTLNELTISSARSAFIKDTTLLLHREHCEYTKFCEQKSKRRSRNATICFVFLMIVVVSLVIIAIISFHRKLSLQNEKQIKNGGFVNSTVINSGSVATNGTNLIYKVTENLKTNVTYTQHT